MDRAIAMHSKIARLEKQSAGLLADLGESLKIRAIWPDAFAHGLGP